MAFCKYSTEFVATSQTEVDNIFINDYLPYAPSDFVKVYLYGLYMCRDSSSIENSLEVFSKRLNMTEEDIENAFAYWEEQGLVQVLRTHPIEIRYIPLKNIFNANKLYKPDKYQLFNSQAQELFEGAREITKNEYNEYYDFLERYHMEQEALLMIIKYCIDTKKSAIGYNYILTVAKNWATEGCLTAAQVEEKLISFEQKDKEIGQILAALGLKRAPFIEERSMSSKWLIEMGFGLDVILYLAKEVRKKGKANFNNLDKLVSHYFEFKLFSIPEIEAFEKNKNSLFSLARSINKAIGVYYESLDSEIENYILKWQNYGFEDEVLLQVASFCFKNSIRTLNGMDKAVAKFYKLGVLSSSALQEYISGVAKQDSQISNLLSSLGLDRKVNYFDRECFKTWTESWKMSEELISYAATLSVGKNMPMQYLGKILASWHDNNVKTLDDAKKFSLPTFSAPAKTENFAGRSYSEIDPSALFQSIDEIDLGGSDE